MASSMSNKKLSVVKIKSVILLNQFKLVTFLTCLRFFGVFNPLYFSVDASCGISTPISSTLSYVDKESKSFACFFFPSSFFFFKEGRRDKSTLTAW